MSGLPTAINGPINLVRLEGSINGNHKIIYLYMDQHVEEEKQTKCPDDESIDVGEHLERIFESHNGHKYDFFMEMVYPYIHRDITTEYLDNKYISKTIKTFAKYFELDRNQKLLVVEKLPNVRFHYADPRYYVMNLQNYPKWMSKPLEGPDDLNGLRNLIDLIISTKNDCIIRQELFENACQVELTKYKSPLEYYVNKIFCWIKNKKLKKIFQEHGLTYIQEKNNQFMELLDEFMVLCQDYRDKMLRPDNRAYPTGSCLTIDNPYVTHPSKDLEYGKIKHMFVQCRKYVISIDASFMDLFFLRRVLDKDYISHAILYAGAVHSVYNIYFLVKYLGFHITHVANSTVGNIDRLNRIVKEEHCVGQLVSVFFPDVLSQCVHVDDFPELYE